MAYIPQSGSVVAFQGNPSVLQVLATVTNNASISGTAGASIIGAPPANLFVGGALVTTANAVPVQPPASGSLPVIVASPSIVGTYAEDSIHATGDKGIFVLGVRNDTTSSFVSANLDYAPLATDSAGRALFKPFAADENRLDTVSSVTSTSVTALFSSVTGLRNYVTDIMVANTGSVATLVTFKDGSTSILGYTIAPAGGGSNINGMAIPMRTAPAQDFVYQAATASSVLYVTAKGYKAP